MLYLSGMRADALASLPIHCVDLANRAISQLPEFGVRTKNHKAAITYLLPIPELLAVVERWNQRVCLLPSDSLWYATLDKLGGEILTATTVAFNGRNDVIRRDILHLCETYQLPYLSPHKLRHGHVVYALKKATTMSQLKGISQNVMHSSVVITDQVYGRLVGEDVKHVIEGLG